MDNDIPLNLATSEDIANELYNRGYGYVLLIVSKTNPDVVADCIDHYRLYGSGVAEANNMMRRALDLLGGNSN